MEGIELACADVLEENHCMNQLRYGDGNSTTAEEVSRFQCLFPNPNWLV